MGPNLADLVKQKRKNNLLTTKTGSNFIMLVFRLLVNFFLNQDWGNLFLYPWGTLYSICLHVCVSLCATNFWHYTGPMENFDI